MNRRHFTIVRELLTLPTAPFCEQAVQGWVKAFVAKRPALRMREDRWGNALIDYGRPTRGRRLVFAAHTDHPGFCALRTSKNGRLRARWMGGVPERLFRGAKVRFFSDGRWVKGTVLSVEPHPKSSKHKIVAVKLKSPVDPGSVGMWDFANPKVIGARLYARGCDDVAGVASLVALLDEACRRRLRRRFSVFLTRAEEPGLLGATGACLSRTLRGNPVIVAVETSKELPGARQGDGPIIRVGDRAGIFTPSVTAFLTDAARRLAAAHKRFRWQRKLMDGGICESSVYVEYGYSAGGLCLPLGNYHNVRSSGKGLAPEYIDMRDFEGLVALYLAAIEDFGRFGKSGSRFRSSCERCFRRYQRLFGGAATRSRCVARVTCPERAEGATRERSFGEPNREFAD